jgi:small-conductance mechanosensitive channel
MKTKSKRSRSSGTRFLRKIEKDKTNLSSRKLKSGNFRYKLGRRNIMFLTRISRKRKKPSKKAKRRNHLKKTNQPKQKEMEKEKNQMKKLKERTQKAKEKMTLKSQQRLTLKTRIKRKNEKSAKTDSYSHTFYIILLRFSNLTIFIKIITKTHRLIN